MVLDPDYPDIKVTSWLRCDLLALINKQAAHSKIIRLYLHSILNKETFARSYSIDELKDKVPRQLSSFSSNTLFYQKILLFRF